MNSSHGPNVFVMGPKLLSTFCEVCYGRHSRGMLRPLSTQRTLSLRILPSSGSSLLLRESSLHCCVAPLSAAPSVLPALLCGSIVCCSECPPCTAVWLHCLLLQVSSLHCCVAPLPPAVWLPTPSQAGSLDSVIATPATSCWTCRLLPASTSTWALPLSR